jgi:ribosome modulation factor
VSVATEVARARGRARRLYPKSKGFQGAYLKGVRAALGGSSIDSCPYRRGDGWRAWRRAWLGGYHSVAPAMPES